MALYSHKEIEEDEMGGTRSTHGTDEKYVKYFGWKTLKVRDHSEDLHVDWRIISERILRK
jgi:hypothetical protein